MSTARTNEGTSPELRGCCALTRTWTVCAPVRVVPASGVLASKAIVGVAAQPTEARSAVPTPATATSTRRLRPAARRRLDATRDLDVARLGQLRLDHQARDGGELRVTRGQGEGGRVGGGEHRSVGRLDDQGVAGNGVEVTAERGLEIDRVTRLQLVDVGERLAVGRAVSGDGHVPHLPGKRRVGIVPGSRLQG